MTGHKPPLSRRNALRTVAGAALTSVAGCVNRDGNTPPSDGNTQSNGQDILQRVAVDGTALVVEFSSDAELGQINLIQPNGELFGKREVAAGAQQVSFEIGTAYTPGEYDVVALNGGEIVAETSLSINPDIEIVEMGIGRNQHEKMWNGPKEKTSEEAFVTIENQGSGPEAVTKLLFIGDVPYPSDEEGTNYVDNEDISGIYDPQSNSEVDKVVITAEEQTTIYSSRSPFAFVPGAGTSCEDKKQTGEFELILGTRVGEDRVSKTYRIQYSASQQPDSCEISVSES